LQYNGFREMVSCIYNVSFFFFLALETGLWAAEEKD